MPAEEGLEEMKRVKIPIGPYHPALAESPELFTLFVEGESVVDLDIRIGYNHRAIEKIAEGKTFHQVVFLVERICGICSNIHPLCFCQAGEDIVGVEIPDRARYIRTIIAELERIHSHLLWLGLGAHIIGFDTLFMWAWKYREPILDVFEMVTGNRQSYAMNRIGGVRRDLLDEHKPKILRVMDGVEKDVKRIINMVLEDPVARKRLEHVGVLSREDARKYCVVGPTARGSGIRIDTRKDHPYAAYDEVSFDVPTREEGDVMAKTVVRLEEMLQSIEIVRQCLDSMPGGEIVAEVKEVPEGDGIGLGEAPRGEDIHYVRSNGSNFPERVKVRAPTYANLPSLKNQVPGYRIADAPIIIAAIDPCLCCTDRVAIVDIRDGRKKIITEREFHEYSRNATRRV